MGNCITLSISMRCQVPCVPGSSLFSRTHPQLYNLSLHTVSVCHQGRNCLGNLLFNLKKMNGRQELNVLLLKDFTASVLISMTRSRKETPCMVLCNGPTLLPSYDVGGLLPNLFLKFLPVVQVDIIISTWRGNTHNMQIVVAEIGNPRRNEDQSLCLRG